VSLVNYNLSRITTLGFTTSAGVRTMNLLHLSFLYDGFCFSGYYHYTSAGIVVITAKTKYNMGQLSAENGR